MEETNEADRDIDAGERVLNDNWNERKHLVAKDFDLREVTLDLILKGASKADIGEARNKEKECRQALARNSEEYEAALDAWVSALPQ